MEVVKLKVTLDQVVALVILRKDLGAESHYLAVPISVPVAQRLIQSLAPIQSLDYRREPPRHRLFRGNHRGKSQLSRARALRSHGIGAL